MNKTIYRITLTEVATLRVWTFIRISARGTVISHQNPDKAFESHSRDEAEFHLDLVRKAAGNENWVIAESSK